jgi:hypothetical protein
VRPAAGRRGIALAAVLLVLLIVAALVAATFVAALQEFRVGRNTILARRAIDAAEAGLGDALGRWAEGGLGRVDSAGWVSFSGTLGAGTAAYEGTVQRLNADLFLVRSTGRDRGGTSRRTVAAVVELVAAAPALRAALTVAGDARVGAGSLVDGSSADSGSASCVGADLPVAGLLLGDSARLRLEGCGPGSCVRGTPPILTLPGLEPGELPVAEGIGWPDLVRLADTIVGGAPPPTGAPSAVVLYAPGDLRLVGGSRRGILLVGGDLVLTDGATVEGLVLVRGTLTVQGAGGTIVGAAVAGGADLGPVTGPGAVSYSPCALRRALALPARARPLAERWWSELF